MNLSDALPTFITESRELLQSMEHELLACEQSGTNEETIATLFRVAHTLKGSAGMFGLDDLVAFTHVLEELLHKVREGQISLDANRIEVLLAAMDHISALVDRVEFGAVQPDPTLVSKGNDLRERLIAASTVALSVNIHKTPSVGSKIQINADCWHISVRFDRELLRHGMDPLGILRYLQRLGRIVSIATVTNALPRAIDMDPEECYLGFEIGLESNASQVDLEAVFGFVRDNCRLRILPPRMHLAEFLARLEELDESERLGEILMRCGVLTSWGLHEALRLQAIMAEKSAVFANATAQESIRKPLGQVVVEEGLVPPEVVEAALATQKRARERKASESASLRVNAVKLDALIEVIGELVIASAGADLLARAQGSSALQEASAAVARLVEVVRNDALQLRMVQIGDTFQRFQRVARDVGKELGKDIELVIHGAETELDKTVVEQITDPLTHLVRNAIGHGIEPAAQRQASGKSTRGCVTLTARHEAGAIVIGVEDDGGGLNLERIRTRGEEKGLITPGQILSEDELARLIFEPGFSTAENITNLCGRGVGMDVVRRNIEALRGEVSIENRPGAGTAISLRLPLTLAIIDGFLIGVGTAQYVLPLDMVAECREFTASELAQAQNRHCINLRGTALPCIHLRDYFCRNEPPARRQNVVVVRAGHRQAGLVVDRLMGEFQTVIKPLSPIFGSIPGVSGSTILGGGEVALILDVPGLIQHAGEREGTCIREQHAYAA